MRKSSRGNPWHDERGRFCSGPSADFLENHEQAYADACSHFGTEDLSTVDNERLEAWISDHGQLSEDYDRYAESKNLKRSEKESYEDRNRERRVPTFEEVDGREFHKAFMDAKQKQPIEQRWRVASDYSEEDYSAHRTFTTDDGSTVSVHDGDIVSVCTTNQTTSGKALLEKAVANGGNKLDAYNGIFGFYVRCGFEPVSVCAWDDEYAPDEWVEANGFTNDSWKERPDDDFRCKREDIVFFMYTGRRTNISFNEWRKNITYSKDYDEACLVRDRRIQEERK